MCVCGEQHNCIVCGKPVKTDREGKVHDKCYTFDVMLLAQDSEE